MLKEKYQDVLTLGEQLEVADGYVREESGKLQFGGTARYQLDKDYLWDAIKEHDGWENEIEANIQVAEGDIYGVYTVQRGDTLGKISKWLTGKSSRYMEIFELNRDKLDNPNMIKVGQELKLPKP